MSEVRLATVDDVAEIIRLRAVVLTSVGGVEIPTGPWIAETADTLHERLPSDDPTFAAFVIDQSDHPGSLAACAIGLIESRLGSPDNPSGRYGYVFNVCTDVGYRRRGYARACMEALLDWYAESDIRKVDLKATADGEPLYRSMGFVPSVESMLRYTRPS